MNSGTVSRRKGGIDLHDLVDAVDAGDRREVAQKIETELVVERRVDRVVGADHQQRVAVGRRARDRLGRDVAAGARLVLDDELLGELLGQRLRDQARQDVDRLAGRKTDHHAHRLCRICLRRSDPRDSGQRERAGGQLLELPAAKSHQVPPIAGFCRSA